MSEDLSVGDRLRVAALRIDRSAAIGVCLVAAVAVVVAMALAWQHRPREVVYSGDGSAVTSAASVPGATPSVGQSGDLVVDVVGRVRDPGLVRVPPGSRVADVVEAAGGFVRRKDAASVNQARLVSDGEQVVVGGGAAAAVAPGAGSAAGAGPAAPIDLNTATLDQLETLPGVGPVLAQRILEHRTTNGRFGSVDELRDVSGIGEKTFADLAPRVRV